MSNNSILSHNTDSDHEEHESDANSSPEKKLQLLMKEHVGWPSVGALSSAPDTAEFSDACCINIDSNLSADVGHPKSLPSFYIERLLGFGTERSTPTDDGCHSKEQDPLMETLLNVSKLSTSEKSTPASLCSTPPSGSAISIASEREWCGAGSTSLAALSPIRSPPVEQPGPGSGQATEIQPSYNRSCLASIVYNQADQQSMPVGGGRKVNAVYIAWPEGRTVEVNLNRFQRKMLTHGTHNLATYGKWPPEPDTPHLLPDRTSHKPNLAKLGISSDPYFHLQGKTCHPAVSLKILDKHFF
uniref:Uncharacterized protein n=1 Tax=Anopheles culicifacies TaxID=139723 RepID=A0A182MMA0_9DIPT